MRIGLDNGRGHITFVVFGQRAERRRGVLVETVLEEIVEDTIDGIDQRWLETDILRWLTTRGLPCQRRQSGHSGRELLLLLLMMGRIKIGCR